MMKFLSVISLLCLLATFCSAFMISSGRTFSGNAVSQRTSPSSETRLSMACRNNSKKAKARRNRDKMNKFRKRGTSRKSIISGQRQMAAQEKEAEFMAKLFQHSVSTEEEQS